jgi:hypothetical protein
MAHSHDRRDTLLELQEKAQIKWAAEKTFEVTAPLPAADGAPPAPALRQLSETTHRPQIAPYISMHPRPLLSGTLGQKQPTTALHSLPHPTWTLPHPTWPLVPRLAADTVPLYPYTLSHPPSAFRIPGSPTRSLPVVSSTSCGPPLQSDHCCTHSYRAGTKPAKFFGNFPYPYMNGLLHLGRDCWIALASSSNVL